MNFVKRKKTTPLTSKFYINSPNLALNRLRIARLSSYVKVSKKLNDFGVSALFSLFENNWIKLTSKYRSLVRYSSIPIQYRGLIQILTFRPQVIILRCFIPTTQQHVTHRVG